MILPKIMVIVTLAIMSSIVLVNMQQTMHHYRYTRRIPSPGHLIRLAHILEGLYQGFELPKMNISEFKITTHEVSVKINDIPFKLWGSALALSRSNLTGNEYWIEVNASSHVKINLDQYTIVLPAAIEIYHSDSTINIRLISIKLMQDAIKKEDRLCCSMFTRHLTIYVNGDPICRFSSNSSFLLYIELVRWGA